MSFPPYLKQWIQKFHGDTFLIIFSFLRHVFNSQLFFTKVLALAGTIKPFI